MTHRPQLWVIAGPNGSGKTTLTTFYKLSRKIPVVNPDEIAKTFPDENPIAAGKKAIKEQERLLTARRSFAIETTLSGKREMALLDRAREAGYKVNLVFIGLEAPEINICRVAQRVSSGGHDIPDEDVIRRHGRAMASLPLALDKAERSFVLDNSCPTRGFRLIISRTRGRTGFWSSSSSGWVEWYMLSILAR